MSRDRLRELHRSLITVLTSLFAVRPDSRPDRSDRGAALVEYTLILGFVVIVCVAALLLLGGYVSQDLANTARGFGP